MTYAETVEYLYNATPQFQRIGATAYKPGLDTAAALSRAFDDPHRKFRSIHVAGTNGKGSTCHTIAAILQAAGLRTGLYTSPHLVDFRERIKVNGTIIGQQEVTEFVERYRSLPTTLSPSFFELTTIMAFDHFARCGVDIAVIETGLGGRLDTTNIISPILTAITNISFDHMAQLGDTLEKIAAEKAGIIKPGVPVVIGNAENAGVRDVFLRKAEESGSPIIFSDPRKMFGQADNRGESIIYTGTPFGEIAGELTGDCQPENAATVMNCIIQLRALGMKIDDSAVRSGFANVAESTGLNGRWMKIAASPLTICDTGHNEGGWRYLSPRLKSYGKRLRMVVGFVNDKDVSHILHLFPHEASYYFTNASIPRAMKAEELAGKAAGAGLSGTTYHSVEAAYEAAKKNASPDDVIFIGGSTFVVADLLSSIGRQ